MKYILPAAALSALLLTACGNSISSDCERLFETNKASCDCFAETLDAQLSSSDLDKVKKALSEADNQDSFMVALDSQGVSEEGVVSVIGASKSCDETHNKSN